MDTFWVWHLIMFNMVQGWRTSLPPVYHTESPATWILGQLRLSILLINRDKQNKTKQINKKKQEKKVKTSFRESVLQFRKIMVGPLDWHKFLRNRLGIMLPFRYVTLRVRVFYLYLHSQQLWHSVRFPWQLAVARELALSFASGWALLSPRGSIEALSNTSRWGSERGLALIIFTRAPQTSSRLVPNFPAGKCASCSSNNKDLLVSWVFESPSTASEPFDNCTSYLCIKSLILTFVIQLELITLNVEKISHRRL